MSHQTLVNTAADLFCVYVFFQKQSCLGQRVFTSLRVLSNFPVLAVLTFSGLFEASSVTFMFDFLFVALNAFKIGLFGYQVLGKVKGWRF